MIAIVYFISTVALDLLAATHANVEIGARDSNDLGLESVGSTLFGENTPVWAAYYDEVLQEVEYGPVEDPWTNAFAQQDKSENTTSMASTGSENKTYHDVTMDESNYSAIRSLISRVSRFGSNNSGQSVKKPETVYPEVLIVVDDALHSLIGNNISKTSKYAMTFMNAVDSRFKELSDPRVELNVAGVIVAQDYQSNPYEIEVSTISYGNNLPTSILINADLTLGNSSKYFYKLNVDVKYDIVLLLTGNDLCSTKSDSYRCSPSIAGIANKGSLCPSRRDKNNKEFSSVAVVEDNGAFNGILAAVHELSHLFDASHDSDLNTTECGQIDGTIMSPSRNFSRNNYFWSECSKREMSDFLNSKKAKCVYNKPSSPGRGFEVDKFYGKQFSLNEQCHAHYKREFPHAQYCQMANENMQMCQALTCKRNNEDTCNAVSYVLDGTVCGENKHCILGECVPIVNSTTSL